MNLKYELLVYFSFSTSLCKAIPKNKLYLLPTCKWLHAQSASIRLCGIEHLLAYFRLHPTFDLPSCMTLLFRIWSSQKNWHGSNEIKQIPISSYTVYDDHSPLSIPFPLYSSLPHPGTQRNSRVLSHNARSMTKAGKRGAVGMESLAAAPIPIVYPYYRVGRS